jgi:malate synthase
LAEETERVKGEVGDKRFASGKFAQASSLFERLSLAPEFIEFLTLPAYDLLLASEAN